MTEQNPPVTIEAAADSVEAALEAEAAGADRIELCARLDLEGLTPDRTVQGRVLRAVAIPVFVMIRPRAGDFVYDAAEQTAMLAAIERAKAAGAAGVVLGALDRRGAIADVTRVLVGRARPLPVTFHRAFDLVADSAAALDTLRRFGVARVLSAGGRGTAWEGRDTLAGLVGAAPPGLGIIAAGRVRADHVRELVEHTAVTEVHLAVDLADPLRLPAVRRALAGL